MSDFSNKVKELLEQGKITPEEAQELLTGHQEPQLKQISLPSTGNERVLRISLRAGDLKVKGNPNVSTPQLVGHNTDGIQIRTEGNTWIVDDQRNFEVQGAGFIDKMVGMLGKFKPVHVNLEVPTFLERLEVHLLAGDIEVQGVPAFVKMDIQAGDVDLVDIIGFDISAKAGDVDITADLREGKHGIELLAGDLDLNLTPSSNARVNVNLTAGDFDAIGIPTTKSGGTVTGGRYEATVGSGDASVTINVNAGDIDLRVK
ncbi:DUF4097 family beta strand repeat-containing protein [Deinococcus roseus]|uniref:DUF4097 domain-containing protein n=1 Tax=Deinococcus roseus TaxID=392414 RepID=A0ABQ2CX22_9DEIO|nr:DUF4097 family beta strand repeat-containing protein [Deinococcus roseus]GGJ25493.1 hypothetical protein GCM10008938_09500 [Deinococcus roseus]